MKNKKHLPGKSHLPLYDVEPFYGAVIIAVTAVAVVAGHSALFEKGMIKGMRIPSEMIGRCFQKADGKGSQRGMDRGKEYP